ncbi:alpha-1,3-mannosyl-glycoprotein 4-beta-N-acetylglucosaminyltransferase B isoform X3 [Oncorhynchus tshawytscha]|uniref:alpha-1,3-mannosyl-glycoprotein 4-beta-N-acetylglucosaminyltransferase B isoform X3 n=1 Tax=Oncorhynchus tshawytscha TaxID=74940 RepID=UPI001C3E45B6|nr:alpha-1,3-mannosyl-glycoprotein 4-beta-N-acetylglucosaminyltransferase B isoform X3 [Oncorhynchus tshawytscha]
MRLTHVKLGCLLASVFLSLTWFTAYNGNDKGEPPYDPKMIQLYERLLAAESRGELVYRELSSLLTSLRNLTIPNNNSSTNVTEGLIKRRLGLLSSRLPNAYLYLPHLRDHADSLNPNVVLGQGRTGVSLVLGIPTVKRQKQSYLVSTLNSLLYDLSPSEREDTVIIVFVAETDAGYVNTVAELIKHKLRETFGDSKDRVKWRTKQNLDYSFLMLYAHEKGTYYVQLEDDIVAKPGYSQAMKTYVRSLASDDWMLLEFSQLGFIGKMFRARDLPMIAEFFLMFHKDKPIDWLLDHILWVKACNPEKDAKDCNLQKGLLKLRYKPSLFQHVGLHSSLPGKVQKLKDKDFGKAPLFAAHSNPRAELSSSLKHYQQHTLERAYEGQDFFWGLTPTAEDFILLSFPQPLTVTGYLFRSGNIEINGDKFYNTTVEVLPSDSSVSDRLVGGQSPQYEGSYGGFIVIGSFVDGMAEGQIDAQMQPISALRLLVHSDSDVWVLLSEIFIKL